MSFVTPGIALIFFVIILCVSALLAWKMSNFSNYDKGAFHTFIAVLSGLGVFVTFLFYYSVIELQQQQQQLTEIQELSRVTDSLLNSVLSEINNAALTIPNFVNSITPLTNTVCEAESKEDPVNVKTCTEKMVLSYRIFSVWQDVIFSDNFLIMDPVAYISNFLQRANSKQLEKQWKVNKINFSQSAQTFGDILFEYGLQIENQTPEEYVRVANQVIKDPKYVRIFGK